MKILFKYEDGDYEMFDGDENEAKYWFKRRIEKAGKYISEAYLFDAVPANIELWRREYEDKIEKEDRRNRHEQDKKEYERLKKQFENTNDLPQ